MKKEIPWFLNTAKYTYISKEASLILGGIESKLERYAKKHAEELFDNFLQTREIPKYPPLVAPIYAEITTTSKGKYNIFPEFKKRFLRKYPGFKEEFERIENSIAKDKIHAILLKPQRKLSDDEYIEVIKDITGYEEKVAETLYRDIIATSKTFNRPLEERVYKIRIKK